MQYALFEIVDGLSLTPQNIGEQLEKEVAKLGLETFLPTAADWGYAFRLNLDGRCYDVSIVVITEQQFGLAIEQPKGVIDRLFGLFKANRIKTVKGWLNEILSSDIGAQRISWYSKSSWASAYEKDFWTYVNS